MLSRKLMEKDFISLHLNKYILPERVQLHFLICLWYKKNGSSDAMLELQPTVWFFMTDPFIKSYKFE